MPYIENEEEKQRREEWDAAFNNLTQKQKDVLRDMWKAYDQWDRETTDQFLLYETVIRLQSVRGSFMRAFPALTTEDDDE